MHHFAIPVFTPAWQGAVLAGLSALALTSHAAPGFREGAYAQAPGTAAVCVSRKQMDKLSAPIWKLAMKERGMDCTVTESAKPMVGHETWKAACTDPRSKDARHLYQFTVHANSEQIVIDSRMEDAAGDLKMKNAFLGTHQGACTANMPPLDEWAYLDGTYGMGAPAQADGARKAVAVELIRCGNVFNGLSLTVAKGKQEGMRTAAAAILEAAVELYPAEGSFHMDELKKSAPLVSAELVGSSAEKKFALYQSCSAYLQPDGIAQSVKERSAAAGATK